MAIFILSFIVIMITMLSMTIAIWFGKLSFKGSCSGAILEDSKSDSCLNCNCEQTDINKVENQLE
jgi:hypothetical protein